MRLVDFSTGTRQPPRHRAIPNRYPSFPAPLRWALFARRLTQPNTAIAAARAQPFAGSVGGEDGHHAWGQKITPTPCWSGQHVASCCIDGG